MCQFIRLFLFAVIIMGINAPARADDPIFICAKDMQSQKMFHAMAYAATGVALNNVSHSSMYDPLGHFVVVAWARNRSSIIKIDGPFATPNVMPTTGIDQDGHPWEISIYSSSTCP